MKTTTRVNIATLRADSEEAAFERGNFRTPGAFAKTGRGGVSLRGDKSTRDALARILGEGETALRAALKNLSANPVLPANWGGSQLVHQVDGGQSWKGWFSVKPEIFEEAARRKGWMTAIGELIAEHPGFFSRALKKLSPCSSRGMNSPCNNAHGIVGFITGDSLERWRTPGRAFRAISHGIRRAKEILAGFNITNVPWAVVMDQLAAPKGPQRGHKIGQRLALATLEYFTGVKTFNRSIAFFQFKGFRHDAWRAMSEEAREFYRMKMRETLPFHLIVLPHVREDDGVKMFVLSESTVRQHQVMEGYVVETYTRKGRRYFQGLRKQTLVKSALGRTFHLPWCPSEMPGEVSVSSSPHQQWGGGGYYYNGTLSVPFGHEVSGVVKATPRYWQRFTTRFAEQAWRVQDAVLKAEGLELPTDRTILVWLEDSYAAGNCSAGTSAFAQANGWGGRKFVPLQWLLDKEPRARAAARVALAHCLATVS